MANVNRFFKGIDLETIFRKILWKNDKAIHFFITIFCISHKSGVKTCLI